jgi:hypothetical protein
MPALLCTGAMETRLSSARRGLGFVAGFEMLGGAVTAAVVTLGMVDHHEICLVRRRKYRTTTGIVGVECFRLRLVRPEHMRKHGRQLMTA